MAHAPIGNLKRKRAASADEIVEATLTRTRTLARTHEP